MVRERGWCRAWCCSLFDVDGTLDVSGGPVPVQRLRELRDKHGMKVVIPRGLRLGIEDFESVIAPPADGDRAANLAEAKRRYPDEGLYVYVSDNLGDDQNAKKAGFCYIHPNFMV